MLQQKEEKKQKKEKKTSNNKEGCVCFLFLSVVVLCDYLCV
jgi:hypothetical protein